MEKGYIKFTDGVMRRLIKVQKRKRLTGMRGVLPPADPISVRADGIYIPKSVKDEIDRDWREIVANERLMTAIARALSSIAVNETAGAGAADTAAPKRNGGEIADRILARIDINLRKIWDADIAQRAMARLGWRVPNEIGCFQKDMIH